MNLNGELIGLNTTILALSGGNIGISFAIPSKQYGDGLSLAVDSVW
ncbi:serine protease domain protein [Candidatus Erwinia dacicola]|uniref:Serine protease domain protein n=1 Tax=Candidatus Erwinia dacicola TaxID=252393 RepID=A0A328TG54_9GAMM|nr:serine protease domain protein [Candidatus Erwinia dacicola]